MSTVQADMESADPSLMFSGVGSSIDITSEARDLSEVSLTMSEHDDGDDEDLYSESMDPGNPLSVLLSLVSTVQSTLQQSQGNVSAVQDVVSSIAGIDVDLDQKCFTRVVIDLLQKNVSFANEGNFKAILTGVDILVKYAVNLLRPKKNPNWRSIKTSNNVFVNKVKPLQGHEAVLEALGYTGRTQSSFEFPESCRDPNMDRVATVTSDLLVLQKELSQFCDQIHVNRDRFIRHFSTLPKSELPSTMDLPLGNTDIPLQRIQPLSTEEKPKEPAKDAPKRPVPAPRRNLPPVPKGGPVVEQPPQPVAQERQPDMTADNGTPSVGTLPEVMSPTQDFTYSGDIVSSVGPIKFPPSFHSSLQSPLQGKTPPKAAPQSAQNSLSTEPSSQLRRPADFVSPPAAFGTQGVVAPVQARPGPLHPQAQYPPTSGLQPSYTLQGIQQLVNSSTYGGTPGMTVASQAGPSQARTGHLAPQAQHAPTPAMPPTFTGTQGLPKFGDTSRMNVASGAGPGHVPPQVQQAPTSTMQLPFTTQGFPQLVNTSAHSGTPAMILASQAGPLQEGQGHLPSQAQYAATSTMPQRFTLQGLQQPGNPFTTAGGPWIAASSQAGAVHVPPQGHHTQTPNTATQVPLTPPTTPPQGVHGMQAGDTLRQRQPAPSTMPQRFTPQGLQQPGNPFTTAGGPWIAASLQAGAVHVPPQGHYTQTPNTATQVPLIPPATPPQGVHGMQAGDTLRQRQPAPSTGIPPKPGHPLGSSVDPPAIDERLYPAKQGSQGSHSTGVTMATKFPSQTPLGAPASPRATGVPSQPSQPMSEKNIRPTQPATKPAAKPEYRKLRPGERIEKCAMCEGKDGIVHCDQCQSARCEACDKRWHSHPKRKKHVTKILVEKGQPIPVVAVAHVNVQPRPAVAEERAKVQPRPAAVKGSPVNLKPGEVVGCCFVCSKDKTEVESKCLTCEGGPKYFCRDCDQMFHSGPDRQGHERIPIGQGRRIQAAASANETAGLQTHDRATPPVGGARPKQPVIRGTNQAPPPQRLPVQSRQPPKRATSRAEQLQARIDDLLAEDLDVLENLDNVKSRYDDARSVDIEGQLMKEEKLLRLRHQRISDEMEVLKTQLEDLGDEHQIQERGDERRPPAPAPQRETYNQQPTNYQDRHQPSGDGPPPLPPRNRVRKWKCEHCTFLNEDVSDNVCVVCSKTTADPQILVEEQEQPVRVKDEVPLRAMVQPHQGRPVQAEGEGTLYQYETGEQKVARLRKQEQEETAKQIEELRQKQQQNMSYRLLIMFGDARPYGYSLEDVKTAWDILDREKSSITPVNWLQKHLEHQLQLIKKDVISEYCRIFKLQVPEQSDQFIGTAEVQREWHQNDGIREKTAESCLKRIVSKVDDFVETTDGIADKVKAAKFLLDNSFDVELAKWELQVQAAANTAQEVDNWLGQMWENAHRTEQTIEKIFSSRSPEEEKKDKVRRILMAERGMLWAAVDCVFTIKDEGKDWPDSIEAVEACNGDLHRAKEYFKECAVCLVLLIRSKLIGLPYCQCQMCTECFTGHFSVLAQNTHCMLRYTCPGCDKPDLENLDGTDFQDYFGLLESMIREYLSQADSDLYQSKLLNWGLMKDRNFRWCVRCSNGFLLDGLPIKKVQCPHCKEYQCFDCKLPWQDQHKGATCEQFEAWKRDNDPELQAQGLAAHLELNGINCPKCKMRYELAKGGCMHFNCPTCKHEFCCGCNLPFVKYPACQKFQTCKDKGLHAHHPRDCLYHLRDEDVATLQLLLQNNNVDYNQQDAAAIAHIAGTCPVKGTKETPQGLEDYICGKPLEGQSGLCTLHYKEYLVSLINQNNLDPADILTANDLEAVLRRNNEQIPGKQPNETDGAYQKRLVGIVKENLPLLRAGGGAAAGPPAAGGQEAGGQAAGGLAVGGLPHPRRGLLGGIAVDDDLVVEDIGGHP